MENDILVPEELILNSLIHSLQNDLPDLINKINQEKSEIWLDPFQLVEKGLRASEEACRPLCLVQLEKVTRKSSDPFVETGTYSLVIKVLLKQTSPDHWVFRYAALLLKFFRENSSLIHAETQGAKDSAVLYSIIETAKANDLEPMHYPLFLFRCYRHFGPDGMRSDPPT